MLEIAFIVSLLTQQPYNWQPVTALALAQRVPVVVRAPVQGWGSYYCNYQLAPNAACPNGGPEIVVYTLQPDARALHHEFKHAYNNLVIDENSDLVYTDFTALAQTHAIAAQVLRDHPNDVWHLWHHLEVQLDYKRELIYEPYRSKWYGYAAAMQRIYLPEVRQWQRVR